MNEIVLTYLTKPEIEKIIQEGLQNYFQNTKIESSEKEADKLFSIRELAIYLKCSIATIHAYKKRKAIPYFQIGRKVFFKKSDVDKVLKIV